MLNSLSRKVAHFLLLKPFEANIEMKILSCRVLLSREMVPTV